jgi:hypothetical protein
MANEISLTVAVPRYLWICLQNDLKMQLAPPSEHSSTVQIWSPDVRQRLLGKAHYGEGDLICHWANVVHARSQLYVNFHDSHNIKSIEIAVMLYPNGPMKYGFPMKWSIAGDTPLVRVTVTPPSLAVNLST